jgi:hypothetical protein
MELRALGHRRCMERIVSNMPTVCAAPCLQNQTNIKSEAKRNWAHRYASRCDIHFKKLASSPAVGTGQLSLSDKQRDLPHANSVYSPLLTLPLLIRRA